MGPRESEERPLTVLVIDVSPVTWGERDLNRQASDKARLAAGKRGSTGPGTLDELLTAVQAFASAFVSLDRDCALIVVAVAGRETAVVYPRKDLLEGYFANPETRLDTRQIQVDLMKGVSDLVSRAAKNVSKSKNTASSRAAMASAFSLSLCLINRFLVATNAGVSALHDDHLAWNRGNADDEGVITAIGGGGKKKSQRKTRAWSPRIMLVQASDDRPSDYNAFMNCAFAAIKHRIVVDCCYIQMAGRSKPSSFLEQTSDLTGGLFLTPTGLAQANKALTEVLLSVFLPPRSCRHKMNLPSNNKVDFRARSFDTGEIVDMAFVCNQCLSIFKKNPHNRCPTCDAEIRANKQQRA